VRVQRPVVDIVLWLLAVATAGFDWMNLRESAFADDIHAKALTS